MDYDKTYKNFAVSFKEERDVYSVGPLADGTYGFNKLDITKEDWLGINGNNGIWNVSSYSELLKKLAADLLAGMYKEANKAQPSRDPLIINFSRVDTENNGLVGVDNGVHFDLDNNGLAEKTAWIDPSKGFLVLDRNGDGKINNGGELRCQQ